MIPTPWKLAGAGLGIALLVAAAWGMWWRGEAYQARADLQAERVRWQAREAEELRRAQALLLAEQAKRRKIEQQAAEAIEAAEKRRIQEVADAEARKERFVADVVSGRIRLFDPCRAAARQDTGGGGAASAPAHAPGADAGADLRRAYAQRVGRSIELGEQADTVIRGLQGVVKAYRKACSAP